MKGMEKNPSSEKYRNLQKPKVRPLMKAHVDVGYLNPLPALRRPTSAILVVRQTKKEDDEDTEEKGGWCLAVIYILFVLLGIWLFYAGFLRAKEGVQANWNMAGLSKDNAGINVTDIQKALSDIKKQFEDLYQHVHSLGLASKNSAYSKIFHDKNSASEVNLKDQTSEMDHISMHDPHLEDQSEYLEKLKHFYETLYGPSPSQIRDSGVKHTKIKDKQNILAFDIKNESATMLPDFSRDPVTRFAYLYIFLNKTAFLPRYSRQEERPRFPANLNFVMNEDSLKDAANEESNASNIKIESGIGRNALKRDNSRITQNMFHKLKDPEILPSVSDLRQQERSSVRKITKRKTLELPKGLELVDAKNEREQSKESSNEKELFTCLITREPCDCTRNQFLRPEKPINENVTPNTSETNIKESDVTEPHTTISSNFKKQSTDDKSNSRAIKLHDNVTNSERQGRLYEIETDSEIMHSRDNVNHPEKQQGWLEDNKNTSEILHAKDNVSHPEERQGRLEDSKNTSGVLHIKDNVNHPEEQQGLREDTKNTSEVLHIKDNVNYPEEQQGLREDSKNTSEVLHIKDNVNHPEEQQGRLEDSKNSKNASEVLHIKDYVNQPEEQQGRLEDNKNASEVLPIKDNVNHPEEQQGRLEDNKDTSEVLHAKDNVNHPEEQQGLLEDSKNTSEILHTTDSVSNSEKQQERLSEEEKIKELEAGDETSSITRNSSSKHSAAAQEQALAREVFESKTEQKPNEEVSKEAVQEDIVTTRNSSHNEDMTSNLSRNGTIKAASEDNSSFEQNNETTTGHGIDSAAEESVAQGYWLAQPMQPELPAYTRGESGMKDMGIEEDEETFDSAVVDDGEETEEEMPQQFYYESLLHKTPQELPSQFGYQEFPEQHGSQQRPSQYGPQQIPSQYGPQERPPQYGPQELPPQYGPQELPPQYGPQELPPQYGSHELPPRYGSQEFPHQIDSEVLPQQYGSQEIPRRYGSQDVSHQYGSQDVPHQYGSQNVLRQYGLQEFYQHGVSSEVPPEFKVGEYSQASDSEFPPESYFQQHQEVAQDSLSEKTDKSLSDYGRFLDFRYDQEGSQANYSGRGFRGKRQLTEKETENFRFEKRRKGKSFRSFNQTWIFPSSVPSRTSKSPEMDQRQQQENESTAVIQKEKRNPEMNDNYRDGDMFVGKLDKGSSNDEKSSSLRLSRTAMSDISLRESGAKEKKSVWNVQLEDDNRDVHRAVSGLANPKEKHNRRSLEESVKFFWKNSLIRKKKGVLRSDLDDLREAAVNTTFRNSVSRMFSDGSGLEILENIMNPQQRRDAEE